MYVYGGGRGVGMACAWRSENNFMELVSFHFYLGSELESGSRLDWPVPLNAEPSILWALANLQGKVIMGLTSLTSKSEIQRASKSVTF